MYIGCPVVENVYSSRSCSSPESLSILASCLFPSRINREYLIKNLHIDIYCLDAIKVNLFQVTNLLIIHRLWL